MSRLITFLHPCHVPSLVAGERAVFRELGVIVQESEIPAEWLKGALEHEFVGVVPDPVPPKPAMVPAAPPEPAVATTANPDEAAASSEPAGTTSDVSVEKSE